MENFEFYSPTRFIFEKDADLRVGQEIKKYSKNVLFVHYGDSFTYESGLHKRVINALKKESLDIYELAGVEPNPKVSLVRKGVDLCKKHNIDFVLAVGGGSVIDTAKAVAIGAKVDHDVWDFFTKKKIPTEALKIGTIMTLPGTGSEASGGAVINDDVTNTNLDVIADDILRPTFTLLNPDLTLGIPKRQTGFGIIDMFSHVLERYMSQSEKVFVTDALCEGLMKAIIKNAYIVMSNPQDLKARSELMWAAIMAHGGIVGVGRQQDWASHGIAAQLSANYNTVHGLALSAVIPAWAKYVKSSKIERFVSLAINVFNVDFDSYDQNEVAEKGIAQMQDFFVDMGGVKTFADLGITDGSLIDTMAKDTVRFGNIGNIKSLDVEDVKAIYESLLK